MRKGSDEWSTLSSCPFVVPKRTQYISCQNINVFRACQKINERGLHKTDYDNLQFYLMACSILLHEKRSQVLGNVFSVFEFPKQQVLVYEMKKAQLNIKKSSSAKNEELRKKR